jgi:hypothetical protein
VLRAKLGFRQVDAWLSNNLDGESMPNLPLRSYKPLLRLPLGQGVGRGQLRDGEAEKRVVGGLRAGWRRKRRTASPEQPGFLTLRAIGISAVRRRTTCNNNSRASQRPNSWIVKVMRVVRIVAGIARQPINATESRSRRQQLPHSAMRSYYQKRHLGS